MAVNDLRAIVRFIGQDSPSRAKEFGKSIRNKVKALKAHPDLGRTGRPGHADWLRELVVHQNYIVFYRVLHERGLVEVLRVKHAAQQVPA